MARRLPSEFVDKGPGLTLFERIALMVAEVGGVTRAGELTDVTRQTVANWISGKTVVGLPEALELAQASGVTLDWVATGYVQRPDLGARSGDTSGYAVIFRYDVDDQGALIETPRTDSAVIAFRESWLERLGVSAGSTALLQCNDDAMSPTIREGALLLVDRSQTKIISDGLYVLLRAGGFAIRRAQVLVDGSVMLLADNSRYHPEKIDAAQVSSIGVAGRLRLGIAIY